jgi:triosephosphate isomerase
MRTPFIAANWKMYKTVHEAVVFVKEFRTLVKDFADVEIVVAPPATALHAVAEAARNSNVGVSGQNMHWEKEGAFTGEVSAAMLVDVGCRYVLAGHSERRHKLGETDDLIARKVRAALDGGLKVILCIGETIEERKANQTLQVLRHQISASLQGIQKEELPWLVVAYEPVWAIGTNLTASDSQIEEAHAFVRDLAKVHVGEEPAAALPILYGGSVSASNAASILKLRDVDGVLVGRASLDAAQFRTIIQAGLPA